MDLDEIKSRINPQYMNCPGTESYERKWLCDEIEQLRQRVQELEQQLTEVRRAEREKCAKVCLSLFDQDDDTCDEAEHCAAAIRAME